MLRRSRNVKILATLGPASNSKEVIKDLHEAGADIFRINMSHSDHGTLERLYNTIREVEAESGRPIGILADLQGPKLRVGAFADGSVELKPGARFVLDLDDTPGTLERVQLPHPEIFASIEPGHMLLLDDGRIRLKVLECSDSRAVTEVVIGGKLSNRKGVNVPDSVLKLSALSQKDRQDLDRALHVGVDWIALSFVQKPEDVAEARKLVAGRALVMAKMEKPAAIQNLDTIISLADGIMVARGDLGVEMPVEQVPGLQKRLLRAARAAGKPVVVATQMLESMISSPMPTRAEVSDVSTAVYEGADAVMLSAESAAGQYPVLAVETMNRIAETVESDPVYRSILENQRTAPEPTTSDAIMAAAREVAETLNVGCIICYTTSGSTALRASRERPKAPILALTPNITTARRMAVAWGVHAVLTEDALDVDDMLRKACKVATEHKFAQAGERVVITAGLPFGTPGATNLLRIAFVGKS